MNENDVTTLAHEMIVESAPERRPELEDVWRQYSPTFMRASDKPGYQMEGGAFGMILFTATPRASPIAVESPASPASALSSIFATAAVS